MSIDATGATGQSSGISATAMANAPKWVRDGSAAVQKDYALGLQFEQMLANELASVMNATAGLGEQGSSSSSEEEGGSPSPLGGGAGGPLSTLMSSSFAESVAGGGLGLAAEMARDMESREGTAPTAATGASEEAAPLVAGGSQAETTGGAAA